MKRNTVIAAIIMLLLVAFFVGLPWYQAYRNYASASGYLGVENSKHIRFVYVDKTHFDAYKSALWFDESLSIAGQNGAIYCNSRRIEFPEGKNVALVRGPDDMIFVELGPEYFQERNGHSEIYYILGKVPHLKKENKGAINLELRPVSSSARRPIVAISWPNRISGHSRRTTVSRSNNLSGE